MWFRYRLWRISRLINFEEERHVHVSSSPISPMSVVDTQGNILQNVHSPK